MRKVKTNAEAYQLFDLLGIKNVSTPRQLKNGTQVFELPIHRMYGPDNKYPLKFATYKSGYIRNVTECNASPYQCNKRIDSEPTYFDSGKKDSFGRPLYTQWVTRTCELIHDERERIVYLANFILKNYYQKPTYQISDYTMDSIKSQYRQANKHREWNNPSGLPFGDECQSEVFHEDDKFFCSTDDVQVIVNGHRYNLS